MGVRNYLIEGSSGAGKTTVAEELERRGHHVIHGDRRFAYYGDPATGAALDGPPPAGADALRWRYDRWIWPVERVKAIVADHGHAQTFFCGGSRNAHHFIGLFDAVFVLEVDLGTLDRRLAGRGDDEFGGKRDERDLIVRLRETGEHVPAGAIPINAARPVGEVVDEILRACAESERAGR